MNKEMNTGIDTDVNLDVNADINIDINTDMNTDVNTDINTDIGTDIGIDIDTDINTDNSISKNINKNIDQTEQKHPQKSPILTVDIIIRYKGGIVLVQRKYPPKDWALPGGHVDYGETVEHAAIREAKEETNLDVELVKQFHVYSDPKRSQKEHKVTVVFIANGKGELKAGDDAEDAEVLGERDLLKLPKLISDHNQILLDYYNDCYNDHYDDD